MSKKPEFTPAQVAFIRDELYGSIAAGAEDRIFQQVHDKAEDIVRWNNAKLRSARDAAGEA